MLSFSLIGGRTGSELMSHCRSLLECCSSCVSGSAGAHFLAPVFKINREAFNIQQILTRWRMFSPKEKGMVTKLLMAAHSTYCSMEIQWFLICFDFLPWFLFLAVQTQECTSPVLRAVLNVFLHFFAIFASSLHWKRKWTSWDWQPAKSLGTSHLQEFLGEHRGEHVQKMWAIVTQFVIWKSLVSDPLCSAKDSAYKIQLTLLATHYISSQSIEKYVSF